MPVFKYLNSIGMYILMGAIIVLLILLTIVSSISKSLQGTTTSIISLSALLVSLVAAFRNELFPFNLKLLEGGVLMVDYKQELPSNLEFVIPLSFLNIGYSEGVINSVIIKVIDEHSSTRIYLPVVEINYNKYLQGGLDPKPESIIGNFSPFPLHAKSSTVKTWLFFQSGTKKYPKTGWDEGKYKFEVYIKESQWDKPKLCLSFYKEVGSDVITACKEGVRVVLPAQVSGADNI